MQINHYHPDFSPTVYTELAAIFERHRQAVISGGRNALDLREFPIRSKGQWDRTCAITLTALKNDLRRRGGWQFTQEADYLATYYPALARAR